MQSNLKRLKSKKRKSQETLEEKLKIIIMIIELQAGSSIASSVKIQTIEVILVIMIVICLG